MESQSSMVLSSRDPVSGALLDPVHLDRQGHIWAVEVETAPRHGVAVGATDEHNPGRSAQRSSRRSKTMVPL